MQSCERFLPLAMRPLRLSWVALFVLVCALMGQAAEPNIILHLKNGDRLTGTIVSETTNQVVIATRWAKELVVPLAEIKSREALPATSGQPGAKAPKPPPASALVGAIPPPAHPKPKIKVWKLQLQMGAEYHEAATRQQIYHGQLKFDYEHPYVFNPKQSWSNQLEYDAQYGRTEGIVSENAMNGSDKVTMDFKKGRFFAYNLAAVGYDDVQLINLRYEVGPGIGYHLLTLPTFKLNLEAGLDYQVQERADNTNVRQFYYRLAEDSTWNISKKLKLTESLEFFPEVGIGERRLRFTSNLSYAFWHNVSLNLSALDSYDSRPADHVPDNDLQILSSVGVTF